MRNKTDILAELREGLKTGVVHESDVRALLHDPDMADTKQEPVVITEHTTQKADRPDKLSAVDIMFYIAGLVLFAAIMSMIVQTWNDGSRVVQVLMSAGVGLLFWAIAYYLICSRTQSDIRRGLINSLLLTGSLSIIAGAYIVTYQVVDGSGSDGSVPMSVALAVLASLHLAYNRLVRRDLILLLGVLLGVAVFPTLVLGMLHSAGVPKDLWTVVVILAAGLLVYATRFAAKVNPSQTKVRTAFDGFAAFVALLAMYVTSFGDTGVAWMVVLIGSVFGIFYLSIISQNKDLLGNGSFFLVLSVITISFKYFSGYGVTTSLIVATFGLLGTAAIAAAINRKYFRRSIVQSDGSTLHSEVAASFPLPIHPQDSQSGPGGMEPDESLPLQHQTIADEVVTGLREKRDVADPETEDVADPVENIRPDHTKHSSPNSPNE